MNRKAVPTERCHLRHKRQTIQAPCSSSVAKISGKLRTSTISPGRSPALGLKIWRIASAIGPAIRSRGCADKYGNPRSSQKSRTTTTKPPIATRVVALATASKAAVTKTTKVHICHCGRSCWLLAHQGMQMIIPAKMIRAIELKAPGLSCEQSCGRANQLHLAPTLLL